MVPVLGVLTRLALLTSLLAGGRLDCSPTRVVEKPDCHSATDHSGSPGNQHPDQSLAHHCTAFHTCALDFSDLASALRAQDPGIRSFAYANGTERLSSLSQLPLVPPPRV